MINNILFLVGNIFTFILSVILYVYLTSRALPDICVRWANPKKKMGDRGLRKYTFPEGRGVVYEPELKMRRFIRQYALICYKNNKYLKCYLNPKIRFVKYDVMVYGPAGELLDIIAVTERVTNEKYSKAVPLHKDTSYVNVILRMADDMYKSGEAVISYSKASLAVLTVLVALSTIGEIYLARYLMTNVVGILTSGWAVYVNNIRFLIYSIILSVACSMVFLLSYIRRTVKVVNNERR